MTCAFAFGAAPALAHEFIASKAGKTHGSSESEQLFKFGTIHISCQKAVTKGAVAAGASKTYGVSIKYAKCLTTAKVGNHEIFLGTTFQTPLAIEYHANGFVETGSEIEEIEGKAVIAGGSAVIKINTGRTREFTKSECHLSWPEQTIPLVAERKPEGEYSEASYSNSSLPHAVSKTFPDGLQHTVTITNSFKGIKYELEGEPCEEWGKQESSEGVGGQYSGTFPAVLGGGNLEFQ
jgi:hypothetical protein